MKINYLVILLTSNFVTYCTFCIIKGIVIDYVPLDNGVTRSNGVFMLISMYIDSFHCLRNTLTSIKTVTSYI
jgi:hypothetical protein